MQQHSYGFTVLPHNSLMIYISCVITLQVEIHFTWKAMCHTSMHEFNSLHIEMVNSCLKLLCLPFRRSTTSGSIYLYFQKAIPNGCFRYVQYDSFRQCTVLSAQSLFNYGFHEVVEWVLSLFCVIMFFVLCEKNVKLLRWTAVHYESSNIWISTYLYIYLWALYA